MTLPPLPHDLRPVAVVAADDDEGFHEHLRRREPVVSLGGGRSWPLYDRCAAGPTVEDRIRSYEDLLDDATVRYTLTPPGQQGLLGLGPDLEPNFSDNRAADAHGFLEDVRELVTTPNGACAYAQAMDIGRLPGLDALVPRVELAGRQAKLRRIWIGSGSHVVDLHYDQMQNLVTVIEGVKRFTLLPPEALPFIYPAPFNRKVSGVVRSLVTVLDVDEAKYPRFASALAMARVAELGPGDVLAIPPLWWHHVESFGFNVMVNMWFPDLDPLEVGAAERTMERLLTRVATLDDRTTRRLGELQREGADALTVEAVTGALRADGATTVAPWTPRRILDGLRSARRSLASLPEPWRGIFEDRYDYYVFRVHGDPYPTLPGALSDFARAHRRRGLAALRARAAGATRRLRRYTDRLRSELRRRRNR